MGTKCGYLWLFMALHSNESSKICGSEMLTVPMQTWQQGFKAPECQNIALPKDVHPDRGSLVSKFASVPSSFLGQKKSTKSAFKTSTLPSMAETDFCLEHLQTYRASVSLCLHRQTHQVDPQSQNCPTRLNGLHDSMDTLFTGHEKRTYPLVN